MLVEVQFPVGAKVSAQTAVRMTRGGQAASCTLSSQGTRHGCFPFPAGDHVQDRRRLCKCHEDWVNPCRASTFLVMAGVHANLLAALRPKCHQVWCRSGDAIKFQPQDS